MYPRNNASPEKIPIGPVVQISDGEVQTSGVTVRIIPSGVAEGDGAGTTAYSTDGVVLYTPTQAETNYASFILIAKKTGCLPASQMVVTTESNVAGRVSLGAILGTVLSEGATGRIAAAWQAAWNVASSVWTSASVNQTGDSYPVVSSGTHGNAALKTDLDKVPKSDGTVAFNATAVGGIQSGLATSANVTSILNAITGLNNLSALANLYGSPLLEIPDSGDPDASYAFTLVVRDNEGKLVALDGSPTITASNAAGTDRSANLSAVSNPATGRYTFTYSVADDAPPESLRIACSGTVSAEARYVEWVGAVVDYDTLTTLLAVKAKTDLIPASPAAVGDIPTPADNAAGIQTYYAANKGTAGNFARAIMLGEEPIFVSTVTNAMTPSDQTFSIDDGDGSYNSLSFGDHPMRVTQASGFQLVTPAIIQSSGATGLGDILIGVYEAIGFTPAVGDRVEIFAKHVHSVDSIALATQIEMDANSAKLSSINTNVGTLLSRITATLFSGITTLANHLLSTARAAKFERTVGAMCTGTVGTGSTTTSIVCSSLDPAGVDLDQFKGRIIIFDDGTTTAALRGQGTPILGTTAAGLPVFDVTALTRAPVNGDTFTIN